MDFVAIDFETANNFAYSACAVGIVSVKNSIIVEKYYSLIQPPDNTYNFHNTRVHGIQAIDTLNAPTFDVIYPKIKELMAGRTIVAHNESFDRKVLYHTMDYYGLAYADLSILPKWEDTVKIYRKKGNYKVNLQACCDRYDIELTHHNALSDAHACAKLFLLHHAPLFA